MSTQPQSNGGTFAESNLTVIAKGHEVEGKSSSKYGVSIYGIHKGDIYCPDATVHVAEGGLVIGNIEAGDVRVDGTVQGDINAKQHLTITGKVAGRLSYGTIELGTTANLRGCYFDCNRKDPDDVTLPGDQPANLGGNGSVTQFPNVQNVQRA